MDLIIIFNADLTENVDATVKDSVCSWFIEKKSYSQSATELWDTSSRLCGVEVWRQKRGNPKMRHETKKSV
ncbi:hypothetical protein AVEN_59731-1 [Araneus ventricosus]|uniref:Uncharacterized protein n=1 Tax=Araneus ventricosus TaxID=182803 RepID=A0A4Y2BNA5_ARAVE|nr:hypothetical protein AVEN_59731-1 [Araneus ventricosus]